MHFALAGPRVDSSPAKIPFRGFPYALAVGEKDVWVTVVAPADVRRGSVYRISTRGTRLLRRISVGAAPQSIAVGAHGVWVVNGEGRADAESVMRIDPRRNQVVKTVRVARATDIAVTDNAVWVAASTPHPMVYRIDPRTNRIIARIAVRGAMTSHSLAATPSTVWLVSVLVRREGGVNTTSVTRIDTRTNRVVQVLDVPGIARHASLGAGALWLASNVSTTREPGYVGKLIRVDPRTSRYRVEAARFPSVDDIATHGRHAWVTIGRNAVSAVDLKTGRIVVRPRIVGTSSDAIAAGAGGVWVVARAGFNVVRVAPGVR